MIRSRIYVAREVVKYILMYKEKGENKRSISNTYSREKRNQEKKKREVEKKKTTTI